jgi:cytochrome c-type biogenesis protein CcmF
VNRSLVGHIGIIVALVGFLASATVSVLRARGRRIPGGLWWWVPGVAGVVWSVLVMESGLVTHDFSLSYVAENNATFTPTIYSITGMWSALEGSILLWSLILALATFGVVWWCRHRADEQVASWALAILSVINAFFLFLMAGPADPFLANTATVHQGAGPNALLQNNPLVAIHPPLLYSGFVGFTVPFAFALAMLLTGRVEERWLFALRRVTVVSWGLLSVGIVMGAWWSYQVLGWGGFWGWDPVENAALLPWLTGTAYIHSIIVQERRGLFRVWNMSLAVITFALTILGTFFTRSGVLQSVHAFSSSTLGPLLIGFFAVTIGLGAGLIAWRGDRLRSALGVDAPWSREGLFVANNVLFVGFAIVVLAGTIFPLLYEAVNGGQVTVGTPYFAAIASPVAGVLLILMALAPVAGWRSSPRAVLWRRLAPSAWTALVVVLVVWACHVRKPLVLAALFVAVLAAGVAIRGLALALLSAARKGSWRRAWRGPTVGGMVTHLGVVVLALGVVISTSYTTRVDVPFTKNVPTYFGGHIGEFTGLTSSSDALRSVQGVRFTLDGYQLEPAITTYHGRDGQVVGTPAITSNWMRDLYVTFDAIGGQGAVSGAQVASNLGPNTVLLGVTEEPLLSWLWIGGLIIGLGAALSFTRRGHDE